MKCFCLYESKYVHIIPDTQHFYQHALQSLTSRLS
jgi:hypothetical protein